MRERERMDGMAWRKWKMKRKTWQREKKYMRGGCLCLLTRFTRDDSMGDGEEKRSVSCGLLLAQPCVIISKVNFELGSEVELLLWGGNSSGSAFSFRTSIREWELMTFGNVPGGASLRPP